MRPDKIYIHDIRKAGYCSKGARRWFEQRGFDFREFIRSGIDCELFLSSGCPMARDIYNLKTKNGDL